MYKWFEGKIYSLQPTISTITILIPDPANCQTPNLAMAIGGVRTHSYDCPPHTEYVKHLFMYEVDWYKYEVDERSQSLHNSITCRKQTLSSLFSPKPNLPLRVVPVE